MPEQPIVLPGSFRDPSGFVFLYNGTICRQINKQYQEHYDSLMNSGLYDALTDQGLLIPHQEVDDARALTAEAYRVIQPEPIPFTSYPYEWCFSQLKHAALLTLQVQRKALDFGMSLKDGSAYNIQFRNGKPILIDTLSFEKYREGQPWVAYRQFCQHFLAPLVLASHVDIRLHQLLRVYLDGIPLDLASRLLPLHTRANFALLSHLHLHARAQIFFENRSAPSKQISIRRTTLLGILDSLQTAIEKLSWQPEGTAWSHYDAISNYSPAAVEHKKQLVAAMLDRVTPVPRTVWDCGANTGVYSRIASARGIMTLSFDNDPAAVEKNYLESIKQGGTNLLPLVLDFTNPSAGCGWENRERMSLLERGPADVAFALALIHHLVISNNLPFRLVARFFSRICRALIIEFVPKDDPQVQKLLVNREDIFTQYAQDNFEREFSAFFQILDHKKITDTNRTLYLMSKRKD